MTYEKYLTVTMSVGTLNNFIWDGNGNYTCCRKRHCALGQRRPHAVPAPEVPALLSHLSDKA